MPPDRHKAALVHKVDHRLLAPRLVRWRRAFGWHAGPSHHHMLVLVRQSVGTGSVLSSHTAVLVPYCVETGSTVPDSLEVHGGPLIPTSSPRVFSTVFAWSYSTSRCIVGSPQ